MAQPQPTLTWMRLPSIARPVVVPEQTPAQPRPPVRAPTQPQEPTPPAATAPTTEATAPKSPPKPAPGGTASLPTSPVIRTTAPSSSLPTSPVRPPTAVPPTTTTSSLPPSPPPPQKTMPTSPDHKPMPTTSSVPTSPITRVVPTSTDRVPIPSPSTRIVKPTVRITTPESPKPKPTAPPPSPLILPLAKLRSDSEIPLEGEQKTVLVQKTISPDKSKPKINGSNSGKDISNNTAKKEPSKDLGTKEKIQPLTIKKLNSDSENGGMRLITIVGENKGAYMEVFRSNKNHIFEGNSHNLRESKIWGRSSSSSSSSEAEEEEERNEKRNKGKTKNTVPMSKFMNSNVQGINSSIVYNSTCSHNDPGVHLALTRKPGGGPWRIPQ